MDIAGFGFPMLQVASSVPTTRHYLLESQLLSCLDVTLGEKLKTLCSSISFVAILHIALVSRAVSMVQVIPGVHGYSKQDVIGSGGPTLVHVHEITSPAGQQHLGTFRCWPGLGNGVVGVGARVRTPCTTFSTAKLLGIPTPKR